MRSKFATFVLSMIPGVGHLYLGLMTRGLQFMILFFGTIFIIVILGMEELFISLPIIWFYNFFDALQRFELRQEGIMEDQPLVKWDHVPRYPSWIAYILIGIGVYILLERFLSYVSTYIGSWILIEEFRTVVVAGVFIFIGLRLLKVGRKSSHTESEEERDE